MLILNTVLLHNLLIVQQYYWLIKSVKLLVHWQRWLHSDWQAYKKGNGARDSAAEATSH